MSQRNGDISTIDSVDTTTTHSPMETITVRSPCRRFARRRRFAAVKVMDGISHDGIVLPLGAGLRISPFLGRDPPSLFPQQVLAIQNAFHSFYY
jgi:hypothetical protein